MIMIIEEEEEIWEDFARFRITSQRLVDQVGTIIKQCWFSDDEILEIHLQINREPRQHINTIIDTPKNKK